MEKEKISKRVQIKEVQHANKDKRTRKPSDYHKSPYKKREIDVNQKPSAAENKLYKWITNDSSQAK